jgi:glycyl-tRNA synthetase beta chain
LADKLDNLAAFFGIEERPTGSKDPFALRRAAIGVSRLILDNGLRLSLFETIRELPILSPFTDSFVIFERIYGEGFADRLSRKQTVEADNESLSAVVNEIVQFIVDRLKVQQREAGVRHDLIDAVFALGNEDDLVRLLSRVNALQTFMASEDGTNLLAGYKRAANILKKEDWPTAPRHPGLDPGSSSSAGSAEGSGAPCQARGDEKEQNSLSYTPEPAEKALIDALDAAEPQAEAAIAAEDFAAAMSALASLRAPIDAFFEEVTVNADEENKRQARLGLLARFRAAVHNVADFSRIEG